jgi:hypothetical protein
MIFHLFLMSASLRPSLGTSAVRTIALYPFFSALCTKTAAISRLLYTCSQMVTKFQCVFLPNKITFKETVTKKNKIKLNYKRTRRIQYI